MYMCERNPRASDDKTARTFASATATATTSIGLQQTNH
jgi:hypothetical protein